MYRSILLAAATLPMLAACNMRDDDATANADAAAAGMVGNDQADLTPEQAGIFDTLWGGGKPVPLAISTNHENGGVLRLNSLQVKPTETVLNVTYVNGHTNDVELNWSNKKTYLTADGRKFFLSPPTGDDDVTVRTGATMTGDLVFLGAVPETQQLQLVVNDGMSRNNAHSNIPGFLIDIPVPAGARSDDGSKKN